MIEVGRKREISGLLGHLAEELDVPPSKYEDAKARYEAAGAWLGNDDSPLARYNPLIYPQGSFALGTAVRPIRDEDYDLDVVCLLKVGKEVTQQRLKKMVGDRIKQHKTYTRILEPEGRRCWTLKYADESKFHMDILPSIPDENKWLLDIGVPVGLAKHAICITDKETWDRNLEWPKSNPKGYQEWFKSRMEVVFEKSRRILAGEMKADVQQVPDHRVRTPLQRVVQLLKRHRDMNYNGEDDKPISIIITTLAARAYNNEDDLFDALLNMIPRMRGAIENRNGFWWVPNPVNPDENFADKWNENKRKSVIFFDWLDLLEALNQDLLRDRDLTDVGKSLIESYGEQESTEALKKHTAHGGALRTGLPGVTSLLGKDSSKSRDLTVEEFRAPSRFNVPHREQPNWPMALRYEVRISARASREGFRIFYFNSDPPPLRKHFSLRFEASTNVPEPFAVYWQVVNTGDEARTKNGLRGTIFPGELVQKETTLYHGMHWIECFIVKDGRCVARSGEFVVNIA